MVDTDQISTSADEPGLVIRNEDVFIEKVRERVALADDDRPPALARAADGHRDRKRLHAALAATAADLGEPQVADVDPAGRSHEIWPVPAGAHRDELLALAGSGELVVADGNHRSLAAQTAGLPALPRRRHDAGLGRDPAVQPADQRRCRRTGRAAGAARRGRRGGRGDPGAAGRSADGRHHSRVRRRTGACGRDAAAGPGRERGRQPRPRARRADHPAATRSVSTPGDKRITYVGGDYRADWLCGEVDAGRAALAILIAPVTVDDFVAVNLAREKLPRKSTWFTPKARAGLVVAEL